jgi:SnoaL-like protein
MSSSIPGPVTRLLEAANRHDTDSFLASFTDDGLVDDWGREFVGVAAIRGWSDREFIGVNVTLGVKETAVSPDDRTTISAEVGGEGYNGLSHFTFAIRDGLVSRMTIRQ